MKISRYIVPNFLIILFVLSIFLGGYLRLINLEKKVFWYDETISLLRVVGYTKRELNQSLKKIEIFDKNAIQAYHQFKNDSSVQKTIITLKENPEHPPLYYIVAHLWLKFTGVSLGKFRLLSVLFSLLLLIAVYYLVQVLFDSPLISLCVTSLLALSPVHLLYAQEARAYSLWTLIIILNTITLVKINNNAQPQPLLWFSYIVTSILGLYTQLFTIFLLIAEGFYLVLINGVRSKIFCRYVMAISSSIILFSPWLEILLQDLDSPGWVEKKLSLAGFINRYLVNFSSIFFDVQITTKQAIFDVITLKDINFLNWSQPWLYLMLTIIVIEIFSLKYIIQHTSKKISLFLISLLTATSLPLFVLDIFLGGQRSTISRYLFPSYIAIQIAVAYLLINYLQQKPKLFKFLLSYLLTFSLISCVIISSADTWWNKYTNYDNSIIAQIINQHNNSLVLSDNAVRLLSLSYHLSDKTKFLLIENSRLLHIPKDFNAIFFYSVKPEFINLLKEKYPQVEITQLQQYLWEISLNID